MDGDESSLDGLLVNLTGERCGEIRFGDLSLRGDLFNIGDLTRLNGDREDRIGDRDFTGDLCLRIGDLEITLDLPLLRTGLDSL